MTDDIGNCDREKHLSAAELYNLGLKYQKGGEVPKSLVEAANRFMLAAEQGNVDAMLSLGEAYKRGRGVPADLILAVKWLYMATANDCVRADRHLRYLRKKLEEKAKLKNPEAMYHLGAMFYNGYGVKQDLGWGFAWFKLAYEYFPEGNDKSQTLGLLCAISEDMWHTDNKRAARAKARIESEIAQLEKYGLQ